MEFQVSSVAYAMGQPHCWRVPPVVVLRCRSADLRFGDDDGIEDSSAGVS